MRFAPGVVSLYNRNDMNYVLHAVSAKPLGLWNLGGSAPFSDYSGHGRAATASGTTQNAVAIVSGAESSSVVNAASTISFQCPVYQTGTELTEFSLEAWVLSINPNVLAGAQQILGNIDEFDGLVVDGTVFSFSIKYSDAPEARVEFDAQSMLAAHAVGVKTRDRLSLFINGELVAQEALTPQQQAGTFIGNSGTLVSGDSNADLSVALNGVAIYGYALSGDTVLENYRVGTRVVGPNVANSYYGLEIPLTPGPQRLITSRSWSSEEDWKNGDIRGATIDSGELVPQIINGASVPGEWYSVCDLYTGPTANKISAINFEWDGTGVKVEASIGGSGWVTVTRGINISLVPTGYGLDPTGTELSIKVSFTGGAVDDEAHLKSLTANVFTGNVEPAGNRSVTYTQPVSLRPSSEVLTSRRGAILGAGGKVSVAADSSSSPVNPKTLEIWYRPLAGNITTNFSGTEYTNGVPGSDYILGAWKLMHITRDSNFLGALNISGRVQVGRVVLYANKLTAEEVNNIYKSYVGVPVTRIGDNSVVTVSELAQASNIYAYDWSIEASG